MNASEEFTVSDDSTILHVIEKIAKNGCRAVVVLKQDVVIGILSEGDIIRALLRGIDIHAPLSGIVQPSFKYLKETNLNEAFDLFKKYAISLIPVVNEKFHLMNVITLRDVLKKSKLV